MSRGARPSPALHPAGSLDSRRARRRAAPSWRARQLLEELRRAVRRAVVDDDDLEAGPLRPREQALEAQAVEVAVVVGDDHDEASGNAARSAAAKAASPRPAGHAARQVQRRPPEPGVEALRELAASPDPGPRDTVAPRPSSRRSRSSASKARSVGLRARARTDAHVEEPRPDLAPRVGREDSGARDSSRETSRTRCPAAASAATRESMSSTLCPRQTDLVPVLVLRRRGAPRGRGDGSGPAQSEGGPAQEPPQDLAQRGEEGRHRNACQRGRSGPAAVSRRPSTSPRPR